MADLRSYTATETLKDGTVVTVRVPRPGDETRIRTAFHNLERETVYTRFFGYKSEVTDAELERITGVDCVRDMALVVTIGEGRAEVVIGGASYFAIGGGTAPGGSAELAFTVEEDYQGLGMASLLIRHLIGIARRQGLARLEAEVLARNLPMLSVFRRSLVPVTVRHEADTVHISLDLAGDAAP